MVDLPDIKLEEDEGWNSRPGQVMNDDCILYCTCNRLVPKRYLTSGYFAGGSGAVALSGCSFVGLCITRSAVIWRDRTRMYALSTARDHELLGIVSLFAIEHVVGEWAFTLYTM